MIIKDCIINYNDLEKYLKDKISKNVKLKAFKILVNRLGVFHVIITYENLLLEHQEILCEMVQELKASFSPVKTIINEQDEILRPLAEIELIDKVEAREDPFYEKILSGEVDFEKRRSLQSWFLSEKCSKYKKDRPPVVSFYSYKGGVGRSTTLAYTAVNLAQKGYKVAIIDFDLEAPGLHSIFNINPRYGVVDFFIDRPFLSDEAATQLLKSGVSIVSGAQVNNKGEIYLLPAGKIDRHYIEKMSHLDLGSYQVMKHHNYISLFEVLFADITKAFGADIILIDSRTGLSEIGGALLLDYSDDVCFVFTNNQQNFDGLSAIAEHIVSTEREYYPNFTWVHNKMSLEGNMEKDVLFKNEVRTEAEKIFELMSLKLNEESIFNYVEIENFPQLNRFNSELLRNPTLQEYFSRVAENLKVSNQSTISDTSFAEPNLILQEIKEVGTGKAENDFESLEKIKLNFYISNSMKESLKKNKYYILGEKGTGKTSLFSVLNQNKEIYSDEKRTEIIQAYSNKSRFKGEDLTELNKIINPGADRQIMAMRFWMYYLIYLISIENESPLVHNDVSQTICDAFGNYDLPVIGALVEDYAFSKKAQDYLREIDVKLSGINKTITALYDNLDKYLDLDRNLRNFFNTGLIRFWEEQRIQLTNIVAKIFIRNDLFAEIKLHLDNRSHLDEYAVDISWNDISILAMLVKRILSRSEQTVKIIEEYWKSKGDISLNLWYYHPDYGIQPFENEKTINFIFTTIFGTRMDNNDLSGYTKNWLINRLKDGRGALYPRELIVMMRRFFSQLETIGGDRIKKYEGILPFGAVGKPGRFELMKVAAQERLSDIQEEYDEIRNLIRVIETANLKFPIGKKNLSEYITDEEINFLVERGFFEKRTDKQQKISYKIPHLYIRATNISQIGR